MSQLSPGGAWPLPPQTPTVLSAQTPPRGTLDDAEYHAFLLRINARAVRALGAGPVFQTTAAENLPEIYLNAFPEEIRQHHNCRACLTFLKRYGALATIREDGFLEPVMWNLEDAFGEYIPVVDELIHAVQNAIVTGVFLSSEAVWGTPDTGIWQHLFVNVPATARHTHPLKTPYQAMAAKSEDFINVKRALAKYSHDTLNVALQLLSSDALYRAEKTLGPARFLHKLKYDISAVKPFRSRRENLVWRAVASAPEAFCHPGSSMIGTLLDDIEAGKDFQTVSRSFAEKMRGDKYQRPQAAPSDGNIARAEKIVEQLGIASALERRFARLDEIQTIWKPAQESIDTASGVFGHLSSAKKQNGKAMAVPNTKMTWAVFSRDVLPSARKIEVLVPSSGNFTAILTAAEETAKPILKWDDEDQRNPFSWYHYVGGSEASRWNLRAQSYVEVTGITRRPPEWHKHYPNFGHGVTFVLAGAVDLDAKHNGLFPEILKSELHEIRATIEAHSKTRPVLGHEQASACGISFSDGATMPVTLRVVADTGITFNITIDRWE